MKKIEIEVYGVTERPDEGSGIAGGTSMGWLSYVYVGGCISSPYGRTPWELLPLDFEWMYLPGTKLTVSGEVDMIF